MIARDKKVTLWNLDVNYFLKLLVETIASTQNQNMKSNKDNDQLLKYGKDLAQVYKAEKAKRKELEITIQSLNAVFAASPDGLVILDEKFVIQQFNPTISSWLEIPTDEIVGKKLSDIFPLDVTPPEAFVFNMVKPKKRYIEGKLAPLNTNKESGWLVVLHDHSDRMKLENQKNEFIALAAHELRTPLIPIVGVTELLLDMLKDSIGQEEKELLDSLRSGGYEITRIVNELLQFAEIGQGHLHKEEISQFSLNEIVEEVLAELYEYGLAKEIETLTSFPKQSIILNTYPSYLRNAIYQLVFNAIKFNQVGGSLAIDIQDHGKEVSIKVTDTGIGINEIDLKTIFAPFFQTEEHLTRKEGGLGLGLSIAKRSVDKLGGSLITESKINQGSTFTIQIPKEIRLPEDELASMQDRLDASQKQSLTYAKDITSLYSQLKEHFVSTLAAAVRTIEAKDAYTRGHTERVTQYTLEIAKAVGFSTQELNSLELAGQIHDIGKIGVPDAVLNKPDRLTDEEFEIIRSHIQIGRKIIQPLGFLEEIAPIAFSHHERYDGKGYPDGLAGEEIPLGGRIMAVADAYDAMTSDRPYRKGMSQQKALSILEEGAGTQWDPEIVEVFLNAINNQQ